MEVPIRLLRFVFALMLIVLTIAAMFPIGASLDAPVPSRFMSWASIATAASCALAAATIGLALRAMRGLQRQSEFDAGEPDRHALARELHDQIGQSLAAIGAGAAFIDRHAGRAEAAELRQCAHDIGEQAREVTRHVRGMLTRLRMPGLEDGSSLADALQALAERWRRRAMPVAVHLPAVVPALNPAQLLALYRTAEEAMTNAWRHSRARHVAISLRTETSQLVLSIADDGIGRAEQVRRHAGCGLLGIAERAALAGGSARFLDAGPGLCIEVRVPIDAADHTPGSGT